jgi:hypothetical protein
MVAGYHDNLLVREGFARPLSAASTVLHVAGEHNYIGRLPRGPTGPFLGAGRKESGVSHFNSAEGVECRVIHGLTNVPARIRDDARAIHNIV